MALNGWADGEPEPEEEDEQEQALFRGMPEDEGRIEVFGFCGSCHSIDLVLQQGLSRSVWAEVIVEMVADHEMVALPPDVEVKVLDYLEEYYGPDRKARRGRTGDGRGPGSRFDSALSSTTLFRETHEPVHGAWFRHPWLTHSRKRVVEDKAHRVPAFRGLRLR